VAIGGMIGLTLAAGIYPKPVLTMLRSEPAVQHAHTRTALTPAPRAAN